MSLVNSYCGPARQLAERTHAAHAVPRIAVEGMLALAFVALQIARDESLSRQRGQLHATRRTVLDHLIHVDERDHFDHCARLRRVVRDLITIVRPYRFR